MSPAVERISKRCHVRARDGALAILLAALRILDSRASLRRSRAMLLRTPPRSSF